MNIQPLSRPLDRGNATRDSSALAPSSGIGRRLIRQQTEVLALCKRVRSVAGPEQAQLIDGIQERLGGSSISVSFIGQVKAGKTSLTNAFMGKPGFLPADVNPWTAVITRVNFGRTDGVPGSGRFSFFSQEEWTHLTRRDGRLQEIVDAIPGSETKHAEIDTELERVHARARFRLGNSYEALLGQSHDFKKVTSGVLERYICAGDDPEGLVEGPTAGRFADITREAMINFDLERFEYPLTMVDTPGLNDPLLIREEVTLRSLECSDVFVLVLNAHQALSTADLHLLRILNALRLDRLIIFINRVDELNDPIRDLPRVLRHVTDMLQRERLPEDIPVICGSAHWAEYALGCEEQVGLQHLEPFCSQLVHADDLASASQAFGATVQAQAWAASGITALDRAVDHMLTTGPGRVRITKACVDLGNALQLISVTANAELQRARQELQRLNGDASTGNGPNAGDAPDAQRLRSLVGELSEKLQREMMDSLTGTWARTRLGLKHIIDDFARKQDGQFAAYLSQAKKKEWHCDTTPLRRAIATFFRDEFPSVKDSLRRRLEAGARRTVNRLDDAGLKGAGEIHLNTVEFDDNVAITTALSKVVSFDMEWGWWQGWLSRLQSHTKLREELTVMIRSQFTPIEQELLATTGRNLVSSANASIAVFLELQSRVLDAIDRQSQSILDPSAADQSVLEQLIERHEQTLRDHKVILQNLANLERQVI